jgi:hypothetical protein
MNKMVNSIFARKDTDEQNVTQRFEAPSPKSGTLPLHLCSPKHSFWVHVRNHLQIIRSKSETKPNGFSILFDFKNISPCKRISVTKICFTLKLQKSVTNSLQNRSIRKAFHFTNVTDLFQIRLTLIHFTPFRFVSLLEWIIWRWSLTLIL